MDIAEGDRELIRITIRTGKEEIENTGSRASINLWTRG